MKAHIGFHPPTINSSRDEYSETQNTQDNKPKDNLVNTEVHTQVHNNTKLGYSNPKMKYPKSSQKKQDENPKNSLNDEQTNPNNQRKNKNTKKQNIKKNEKPRTPIFTPSDAWRCKIYFFPFM